MSSWCCRRCYRCNCWRTGLDVLDVRLLSVSEGHEGAVIRSRHGPIVELNETAGLSFLR